MELNYEQKPLSELHQLAYVICWLDEARWETEDWGLGWDDPACQSLNSSEKMLAHWITYITDMQMRADIVWERGLPIFAELVHEYTSTNRPPEEILVSFFVVTKSPSKEKVPTISKRDQTINFTPRYKWHYDQIIRTLELLTRYDRSLVEFIKQNKDRWKAKGKSLRRVAHALDLLTYRYDKEKAHQILNSENFLLEDYDKWEKAMANPIGHGRKRLWAAIRDYIKFKPFRRCLEESSAWSDDFTFEQLELPGDIWNIRFTKNIIFPLAKKYIPDVKLFKDNFLSSSKLARFIYEAVGLPFYPERLDVSFDFAPRMCERKLCDICIFGQNEAKEFCQSSFRPRICPVLLICAGYKRKCKPEACPVINDVGAGICPEINRHYWEY
ncbi:MAG: hypothetical protein NC920_02560 [Candidatus Omnitrophica bacterium]|nr:hypothetical protein [Candidatus Omnitrophota bacterium]